VVNGFSKTFSMTGWRLGYACGPAPIIKQVTKIHQFAIMCAPTASQLAAIEALREGDEDIEDMKAEYNRRRVCLVERLREMGLSCFTPEGAFYVFPNISGFGMNSEEFCEKLLKEYGVAIVPGTAFGACGEGYARISYAYSMKHINQALDRMEKMIADLKG
ncbi:MAG: aminotransferase class I/II-fold pyridoxal phosphate-dependent enzyme, partial [Clostridia bacterium]|nr:aminotransferase class I/II-fold pyridoxal phosphate-dependent enzyme [Clostridia bacterium]